MCCCTPSRTTTSSPSGDEQRLIGLINRMRLFAPHNVVSAAEAVLRAIVEIALRPSIELRQLAKEALSKSPDPDPLLAFSEICRADLDSVRRSVLLGSIQSRYLVDYLFVIQAEIGWEGLNHDGEFWLSEAQCGADWAAAAQEPPRARRTDVPRIVQRRKRL